MAYNKCYNKWFFSKVKKAIGDYKMIADGDRIAVGVSGKDSIALLYILNLLRQRSALNFDLRAIHVDLGLGTDTSSLADFCSDNKIVLHVQPTQIGAIIFKGRAENNPCSLCSKMRKGALNNAALELGCNKIALGHHLDDAIETLLLNLIYTGKLGTFPPKSYLDRKGLTLIRPLIYIPEATLSSLADLEQLPQLVNNCPADGKTKREEMKQLLCRLKELYPDVESKFLSALQNVEAEDFWQARLEREEHIWLKHGAKTSDGDLQSEDSGQV